MTLIAIQLWMQERDRRGRRLWILGWSAMLVVWLNLHAGFVVGLGLMAIHAVERMIGSIRRHRTWSGVWPETWHLAALPVIVAAALPCNPYGWAYVEYLIRALTMPRPTIAEWLPLWHTYAPTLTLAAFGVSVASVVGAVLLTPGRRIGGLAGLIVAAVMALRHIRHGSIYAVLWIAYAPAWITGWLGEFAEKGPEALAFVQSGGAPPPSTLRNRPL